VLGRGSSRDRQLSLLFTLRGVTVNPEQGVPTWPVLDGNTVIAGTSPVTLTFADGSTIILDPGAEAILTLSYGVPEYVHGTGPTPVFRLRKGAAYYSLKTPNSVVVISGNESITITSLTGRIVLEGAKRTGAVLAVVGAGAAAGLGVGVSKATSGGSSVSPSH